MIVTLAEADLSGGGDGGDGGGGDGGSTVVAGAADGAGGVADPKWAIGSLVAVAGWWVVFGVFFAAEGLKPKPPVQLAEGIAAFALFYVAAQAIERLLEPIASLDRIKQKLTVNRDKKLASAIDGSASETAVAEAAAAQDALNTWRANRTVAMWAAATILGMIASATLGLYFVSALVDPDPDVRIDILITGLAIGGGTKPLHDLITKVQAQSAGASDEPAVVP